MRQPHESRTAHADPDLQNDVNGLILDYMVCLAIEKTLSAAEAIHDTNLAEEADWFVQSLKAFSSLPNANAGANANLNSPLAEDLHIKIDLLWVAHSLRCHRDKQNQNQSQDSNSDSPSLANIGIRFMTLCQNALPKISISRWLDIGAQFVLQATLEESKGAQGRTSESAISNDLIQLRSWRYSSSSPAGSADSSSSSASTQNINNRWKNACGAYPYPDEERANHDRVLSYEKYERLKRIYPFTRFKETVMKFVLDFISVLDQPALMELERGKLGNLSREETAQLLERAAAGALR